MALPLHLLDIGYDKQDFKSNRSPKAGESVFASQLSGNNRNKNGGFHSSTNRYASLPMSGKQSATFQGVQTAVNESAVF